MVHQELSLCPHLSVTENVTLGRMKGLLDRRAMRRQTEAALSRIGASIDPDARVADLAVAEQQLVEIARAVMGDAARVIILDEPTSSLGAADVERLFALVRRLREEGASVLYISHFLEEIKAIADRFTVLRDGKSVGQGEVASTSTSQIVSMMAGRSVEQLFTRSARSPGEVVLTLDGLAGEKKPSRASLELRRGEVLGIAGLMGAGRTEMLRAVFGLDSVKRGTIKVKTWSGPASPARRLAQGVGLLSEDRKGEGLALPLSIADNVTMAERAYSPSRARKAAAVMIERLRIRARDPDQPVRELSGGNQQKVALARLLHEELDVLLLDEPTRGIDIASKAQIYELVDDLARSGKAILVVSSQLPELLGTCDRIAVMSRGVLGDARPASEWDERTLLAEAVGA
jgi:ribose transport system ATP-binding protein